MACKMKFTLALLAVSTALAAAGPGHAQASPARDYFAAAARYLLLAHACSGQTGAQAEAAARREVASDLARIGYGAGQAEQVIRSLVASHGPAAAAVVAEESARNPAAAETFCSDAMESRKSLLDAARLAAGLGG